MAKAGYETICANCQADLEFDEALKVGQMVKCSECGTYMQILALESVGHGSVGVAARRIPTWKAREMGYP